MKVRVVQVGELIAKEIPGYRVHDARVAVLVSDNGQVIITNDQAMHEVVSVDGEYEAPLYKVTQRDGKTFNECVSSANATFKVKELLDEASNFAELGDFIRRGKDRIDSNYKMLLNSIESLGLNPADYSR